MKILVFVHSPFEMWRIPQGHVERLRRAFPAHTFVQAADDPEALDKIADVEAAFSSQVLPEQLKAARALRWIHSPAAGVGGMLYPDMLRSPVVLTNSRAMASDTIAEHVLAVTLAMFRRLPLAVTRQAARTWAQDEIGAPPGNRSVAGSHVLIVGLGSIGEAVASRMAALGARVTGIRRRASLPAASGVSAVEGPDRLRGLLPTADVVVVAAPETRETRGLIGADELRAMKRGAILVNVSRGTLVDERALAAALADGRIGGAALDVFEHEPLEPGSPLWGLPNALITPHTSGFRPDHWDAATDLFAENLRRYERGHELLNVVDKHAGY